MNPLLTLLLRLTVLFCFHSFLRLLFLFRNLDQLASADMLELVSAGTYGLLFDASVIFTLSAPFILCSLIPFPFLASKAYQLFLRLLYFIPNALFLIPATIDLEFYRFTDRHTTIETWFMRKEASAQATQLIFNFWWVALITLAVLIAFWWIFPPRKPQRYQHPWTSLALLPLWVALSILAIRGSVDVRPLSAGHAFRYKTPAVGNLALSTPFSLLKSIQSYLEGGGVSSTHFFKDDSLARDLVLKTQTQPLSEHHSPNFENVFILIVESLSSEFVGFESNDPNHESFTPFLDSLAAKGVAFTNHYANSRRSITALPAILASIPDWIPGGFSTSIYQNNTIYGLGHGLLAKGYSTWFFHGARDGTMTFDYMSRIAGFQNYYAQKAYGKPGPDDLDGAWGIYDDPMLQRSIHVLSEAQKPFAAVLFTLSTHQPFRIPPQYSGKFKKGTLPIHESLGYADFSIQHFFERAAQEPWFKRTLFVITGDHTAYVSARKTHNSPLDTYDVPLVFYHPGHALPHANTEQVASQNDIAPSVLHLLGINDHPPFPFGRSLFGSSGQRLALLHLSDQYGILTKKNYLLYSDGAPEHLYDLHGKVITNDDSKKQYYSHLLRAHLQVFRNGLIENSWFPTK